MSPTHLLRLTARQYMRPQHLHIAKPCITSLRSFTQSAIRSYPRKDSQDKDSINTEATEYSKSGTDDGAARQEDAAFDPSITEPGHEKNKAGEGIEGNPLDVSPANPEVSKQRGPQEGGAQSGEGKKQSGGGSPNKNGTPQ